MLSDMSQTLFKKSLKNHIKLESKFATSWTIVAHTLSKVIVFFVVHVIRFCCPKRTSIWTWV